MPPGCLVVGCRREAGKCTACRVVVSTIGLVRDIWSGRTADLLAISIRSPREPAPARQGAAFLATAVWLGSAFSELSWDVHDVVADGELVVVHATMRGIQTGTFVSYGADARVVAALPPRGGALR